jgi:hypothetical protein
MSPERLRSAEQLWATARPEARLRSLSSTYNCVGLVFASRRTWVDPQTLPLILGDDGYRQLPPAVRPEPGDVVIYRTTSGRVEHIGTILASEPVVETSEWRVTVISQWGADGEYVHPMHHVPLALGQPSEYWTERQRP